MSWYRCHRAGSPETLLARPESWNMFQRGANRLLVSSATGSGAAAGCAGLSDGGGFCDGGGFVCDGGGVWALGDVAVVPAFDELCPAAGTVSARTDAATDNGPHTRERNSRISVALSA